MDSEDRSFTERFSFANIFNVMESKKIFITLAIIAVAVILAVFGGWYIYRDLKKISLPSSSPSRASSTSAASLSEAEIKKQMPDLDREIMVKISVSDQTKSTAIQNIKEITARLKKDYNSREDWLTLGIWRKLIGDYEGAEQAWQFVTLIRPDDPVAYNNLGDLYSQDLIDFSKAEKYYLLAIEKSPQTAFYYEKLYEFYRYFLKRNDLAENILVQGIKATNEPGLQTILDDFRKEIGK